MQVRDIMTENPVCCLPDATIQGAAGLMVEHDCGEIPVTDEQLHPLGIITDRDICCRAIARGKNLETPVSEVMTGKVVTIRPQASIYNCYRAMEEDQIRRLLVVNEDRSICGVVSQADLVRGIRFAQKNSELLRQVSRSNDAPSMRH